MLFQMLMEASKKIIRWIGQYLTPAHLILRFLKINMEICPLSSSFYYVLLYLNDDSSSVIPISITN